MKKSIIVLPNGKEIRSGVGQVPAIQSVTHTRQVNAETDLMYGSACTTLLEITLLDSSGAFSASAGEELIYYTEAEDKTRTLIGHFRMEKPTKPTANTYKITAYDRMTMLDIDLSMWLAELEEWPYTMQTLLEMVCAQCGVELQTGIPLVNGSYPVRRFIENVTGRKIVQWIAEANAVFAEITQEGKLTFGQFSDGGSLDLPIKSVKLTDYNTATIERVAVKRDMDDIGIAWPENSTGETYSLLENPLLTADNAEELLPYVKNIYDQVAGITYLPAEIQVFDPDGVCRPGVFLAFKNRYGKQYRTAVFSVTSRGATSTLRSTGNASRTSSTAIAGQDSTKVIQGRVARLKASVEEVSSELSKTTISLNEVREDVSIIKQQVDQIRIEVSSAVDAAENAEEKAEDAQRKLAEQATALEVLKDGLNISVKEIWEELDEKADQDEVTEITECFHFGIDGLTISNSTTGMGIGVSEQRVIFTGGQDPTTVITPNAMETTNLTVGIRLDLGDFSWIPRTNKNLSLRWMGG